MSLSNEFDAVLRSALLDAQRLDWAPVLEGADPAPEFSPRYLRQEAKLLKDPFSFAKRQARPVWRKVLRAAAYVLLAIGLAGAFLWTNPTTRAWVEQFFFQRFGNHDEYRLNGDSGAFGFYLPSYIPEDFVLVSLSQDDLSLSITYQDENGAVVCFDAMSTSVSSTTYIDNEHFHIYNVQIGTATGTMYDANTPTSMNHLLWINEENSIMFILEGALPSEELITMAESVKIVS